MCNSHTVFTSYVLLELNFFFFKKKRNNREMVPHGEKSKAQRSTTIPAVWNQTAQEQSANKLENEEEA